MPFILNIETVDYDITNDVLLNSIEKIESVFNPDDLSPTTNKLKFTLSGRSTVIPYILSATNKIAITVTGTNYNFAGYVTDTIDLQINQRGQSDLQIDCEDPGIYKFKTPWVSVNGFSTIWTAYQICSTANPSISFVHSLCALAGVTVSASISTLTAFTVNVTVVDADKKTYWEVLQQVLFEFGYIPYFDSVGELRMRVGRLSGTISFTFATNTNINNIKNNGISISKRLKKYDGVTLSWKGIKTLTNQVIFQETTGKNSAFDCYIQMLPGTYWPTGANATTYSFADYSHADYEILSISSITQDVIADAGITYEITNCGTKIQVRFYNPTGATLYIKRLNLKGSGTFIDSENKTTSAESGKNILNYEAKYINDNTKAAFVANQVQQYYKFANYTYKFYSTASKDVGSNVYLNDPVFNKLNNKKVAIVERITRSDRLEYEYTCVGTDTAVFGTTTTIPVALSGSRLAYTWIAYSDNADGTGATEEPGGLYRGVSVSKDTSTQSLVPTDYVWEQNPELNISGMSKAGYDEWGSTQNKLSNSDFAQFGSSLWTTGWTLQGYNNGWNYGINLSGWTLNNESSVVGNNGNNTIALMNTTWTGNPGTASWSYIRTHTDYLIPVSVGEKYCASVYIGAHRCNGKIAIICYNSSKVQTAIYEGNENDGTGNNILYTENILGGTSLSDYKRIRTTQTIPSGTAYIGLGIFKSDTYETSFTDSYVFFCRAMLEKIPSSETEPRSWHRNNKGIYIGENGDVRGSNCFFENGYFSGTVNAESGVFKGLLKSALLDQTSGIGAMSITNPSGTHWYGNDFRAHYSASGGVSGTFDGKQMINFYKSYSAGTDVVAYNQIYYISDGQFYSYSFSLTGPSPLGLWTSTNLGFTYWQGSSFINTLVSNGLPQSTDITVSSSSFGGKTITKLNYTASQITLTASDLSTLVINTGSYYNLTGTLSIPAQGAEKLVVNGVIAPTTLQLGLAGDIIQYGTHFTGSGTLSAVSLGKIGICSYRTTTSNVDYTLTLPAGGTYNYYFTHSNTYYSSANTVAGNSGGGSGTAGGTNIITYNRGGSGQTNGIVVYWRAS